MGGSKEKNKCTPIPHSPAVAFIFGLLSGGVYFFYWIYRMMRDINSLSSSPVFKIKRIIRFSVMYLFVYCILFAYLGLLLITRNQEREPQILSYSIFLWVMSFGWIAFGAYLLFKISEALSQIQKKHALTLIASPNRAILLFFLCFLVVPYLQKHLNSLLIQKSSKGF